MRVVVGLFFPPLPVDASLTVMVLTGGGEGVRRRGCTRKGKERVRMERGGKWKEGRKESEREGS